MLKEILRTLFYLKYTVRNSISLGEGSAPSSPTWPQQLNIEVTNLCNANCVFCGYQYQERPIHFMSFELFKLAIDQYVKIGGGTLGMTPVVGDALIDKGLSKKITYARQFKEISSIALVTNGILLNRKLFEDLVDAGLTELHVSISGFDRQEYQRLFRSPHYERVILNLRSLAGSNRFPLCPVTVGIRTDQFLPGFKREYWKLKSLGFKISRTFFFDSWSGRIKPENLPGMMQLRPKVKKKAPCSILYSGPTVLANGKVTACGCRDLNGDSELTLGDIRELSLSKPWEDGTIERLRQRFIDGNLPDLCRSCRHYSPMRL